MKMLFFFSILFFHSLRLDGQKFELDTIVYHGKPDSYINIVILGDGFTAGEQTKFLNSAKSMTNFLFDIAPWKQYRNYFNVFSIKVISNQSGANHANSAPDCPTGTSLIPTTTPDTYFGCAFDQFDIHRLVVPTKMVNIGLVLANNFPQYDQVLILSNTPHYGGSGGTFATATLHSLSNEIAFHEIGHSFAALADEYYAGDIYARELSNMTKETNPEKVKWKNWLGHKGVGLNQHCCSTNAKLWYKPHNNCKMQALGQPFCSVCEEAIVERIHQLTTPVIKYLPIQQNINSSDRIFRFKLTELILPQPNTLKIDWQLDGNSVLTNVDSFSIDQFTSVKDTHYLSAIVYDSSTFVRKENHSSLHFQTINWNIIKTLTGTQLVTKENKIDIECFPNPSTNYLTLKTNINGKLSVDLMIAKLDGVIVEKIALDIDLEGKNERRIDVSGLPKGYYHLIIQSESSTHSIPFIKI